MLWFALIPKPIEGHSPEQAQRLLAWWALRWSPRVACLEEAVVVEVAASLRLFGGEAALYQRLQAAAIPVGFRSLTRGPTSLGALALARHGGGDGLTRPWREVLDALPLSTLSAASRHHATLSRLGCQCLGDVRRLPRAGLARRFDAALLMALDQAYELGPETHPWVTLPEVFDERLELPGRVESTEAVMHAATHLLSRLQHWLTARHAGVRAIVLRWRHDMPSREAGPGNEVEVRTAEPARTVQHLGRLLAEHLAKVRLQAPVGELSLHARDIEALPDHGTELWPELPPASDAGAPRHPALTQTLERLSIRLGAERVLRPLLLADHRPGHMQGWCAATQALSPAQSKAPSATDYPLPLPTSLLDPPRALPGSAQGPQHHGPLTLLSGPHRIESGWWDTSSPARQGRDYYVAHSPRAGLLWIYQERPLGSSHRRSTRHPAAPMDEGTAWFLHGVYG